MAELITTAEAGERLGVTRHRVLQLINAGRLPAQKVGMQFLVRPADLVRVKDRPPGRPPKASKPVKAKRKGAK